MLPKRIFITGTGTDVGKTVISTALAFGLLRRSINVTYWKPVQAGQPEDADMVRRVCGTTLNIHPNGFTYEMAASPDQAAAAENAACITVNLLQRAAREVAGDVQLIEGAGGLFVPLNQKPETWADFLAETGVPVIVVALAGLGTLNHIALTIEALQLRQVPILGIVLNGETHEANQESLKRMLPQYAIHAFPHLPELDQDPNWEAAATELTRFLVEAVENAVLSSR